MSIKRTLIVPLSTALLIGAAACADADPEAETEAPEQAQKSAWSYGDGTGPEQWASLSAEYAACKAGQAQSPINIPARVGAGDNLPSLDMGYSGSSLTLKDTGHGFSATPATDQMLTIGDQSYKLLQFHAHTPGEHTIDGKSFPMEVHFVHVNAAGQLAVVGVMVEEGARNEGYSTVTEALRSGQVTVDNVSSLLPSELAYHTYDGSLTTPPCTEGVRWIVLKKPVTLSAEQVAAWKTHGETNRPVVPANERKVGDSGR